MNIPEHLSPELLSLLPEKPALLALDFDGVMTDDRVFVTEDGTEMVACTRGDGMGITMLRRAEFPVLIISTEENPVVAARSNKLKVECIHGCKDKTREFREYLSARKIPTTDVVFVGNDLNDIGCLQLAGCGLVVADAKPLAKKAADGILSYPGGRGAVREIAEMILIRLGREIVFHPNDLPP